MRILEHRRLSATLIFDLEDAYARRRGVRGPHPRPLGEPRLRLLGEMVGGVRQDFERRLELLLTANPSGYHLFRGKVRLDDGSRRHFELGDGTYVVEVESDFYQTAVRSDVVVPQRHPVPGPYHFDLEAGYAYPFPREHVVLAPPLSRVVEGPTLLRGVLLTTGGRGIGGAEVREGVSSARYLTDDTGQWVLVFADTQPAGAVTVRFTLPDAAPVEVTGVQVVPGEERGLAQAALRGRVTLDGVPLAGARIRVVGRPGEAASGGDGTWAYYFAINQGAGPVDVTAELPDGQEQTAANVAVVAHGTVEVAPFRFQSTGG